jgi:hypothetical protein
MIKGANTGIVKRMREYVGTERKAPIDLTPLILETLTELLPYAEELQRKQWQNNEIQTGAKMGDYAESTKKRWKKSQDKINLYQKGDMYAALTASLDEVAREIKLSVESPRWAKNYIHLKGHPKIGENEEGEPAFMGLTEESESLLRERFRLIMARKIGGRI